MRDQWKPKLMSPNAFGSFLPMKMDQPPSKAPWCPMTFFKGNRITSVSLSSGARSNLCACQKMRQQEVSKYYWMLCLCFLWIQYFFVVTFFALIKTGDHCSRSIYSAFSFCNKPLLMSQIFPGWTATHTELCTGCARAHTHTHLLSKKHAD